METSSVDLIPLLCASSQSNSKTGKLEILFEKIIIINHSFYFRPSLRVGKQNVLLKHLCISNDISFVRFSVREYIDHYIYEKVDFRWNWTVMYRATAFLFLWICIWCRLLEFGVWNWRFPPTQTEYNLI